MEWRWKEATGLARLSDAFVDDKGRLSPLFLEWRQRQKMIRLILDSIQVSIRNVHIVYIDSHRDQFNYIDRYTEAEFNWEWDADLEHNCL
ncbi:hypothetical protein MUK42_22101 [Musa troglodytarum]|uniref:Uncharacterized protein n=1 Tax=Musa troglodytarum TaxID=320322 RepID=A0A9E7H582_9LILI|nr:hypothetical protein MUK42_22101 [Musa troglodytarum]